MVVVVYMKFPSKKWGFIECIILETHTHVSLHYKGIWNAISIIENLHVCSFSAWVQEWEVSYSEPLTWLGSTSELFGQNNPITITSMDGRSALGKATWSSMLAALDVWKPCCTSGAFVMFLTLALPQKGSTSGAAWKELLQLHSSNRLSPYLSPCSLTTAQHMPLQPQRPTIVILPVLNFPQAFPASHGWSRMQQPTAQSHSDQVTATQCFALYTGKMKPSE